MRGLSLGIAVLFVSISCVVAAVRFERDMNNFQFIEPLGNDYPGDQTAWEGQFLNYTLKAVNTDTGTSENIEYGFNSNQENPNDDDMIQTSTYFRIEKTTGNVYLFGNKLDYENVDQRTKLNLPLIARNSVTSEFVKTVSKCNLLDRNDNRPRFLNESLQIFVPENAPPGNYTLKNIQGIDVDTEPTGQEHLSGKVQYCIIKSVREQCSDRFEMNRTKLDGKRYTGDFVIKEPLDYEVAGVFQVQIQISDGFFTESTDVTINVIDRQDQRPTWDELDPEVFTPEEIPVNGLEILVKAIDQDTGKRDIHYEILTGEYEGVPINEVFEINNVTGVIRNKVHIDLEDERWFRSYRPKRLLDKWPIDLRACEIIDYDPIIIGDSDTECIDGRLYVKISDINDNRPIPDQDIYVYEITEVTFPEQSLQPPRIEIFDRDTDEFNKYDSLLEPPSDVFMIGGSTNSPVIQVKDPSLIDYEDPERRRFELKMIIFDREDNNLNSTATIIIDILDVNDNRAVFSQDSYTATIDEDAQETTNVIRIEATDIDSLDFGTSGLRYQLSGSDLFTIDDVTGQVQVAFCQYVYGERPCLDYDFDPKSYTLSVRATDRRGSPQGLYSTVTLVVNLRDVNDNGPEVPDYDVKINENQVFFDPRLIVKATDKDNSPLIYTIESQAPGSFWAINHTSGEIFVNKTNGTGIKYEEGDKDGKFVVLVKVSEVGGKYWNFSNVLITVLDSNDNGPRILPSFIELSINETTPPGTFIVKINAKDEDDPTTLNGQLNYRIISGNTGGKFEIEFDTGVIKVAAGKTFDREKKDRYEMEVVVNDRGQPSLSATATVIVNILDTNNKDPVIDPFVQEYDVLENVGRFTSVGAVNASDPDFNAVLRYEFIGPYEASSNEGFVVDPNGAYQFQDLFVIDDFTGEILVNQPLDHRRAAVVSYGVLVRDITPTDDIQVGIGRIVININPFNSQPPVFEPYPAVIFIFEEQPIGSVIISLIAQDDNDIRLFDIFEQPHDYFAIGSKTGSVSIKRRIDYDNAERVFESYFKVRVTDTGKPELSAEANVTVVFININDNFPEFIDPIRGTRKSIYTAKIPENSPDGTPIGTAYAFDNDFPDNNTYNQVRYYMEDDRFDVDPMTGDMFVRLRNGAVLDRESNPRLNARVIAIDNPLGPPDNQNRRAASVQVTLTDVNDNCPRFTSNEYQVTIFETIVVDTDILQLFYTDRDIGKNAIAYYSQVKGSGVDDDFFGVRREVGRIYVKKSLVRYTGTYTFTVQATDNVGFGCKSNATVIIKVMPSANVPPVWVIPPIDNMTIVVLEEQYNGMLVYDVSARDEDSGVNGVVDYSFIYNGETTQATPDFKINEATGVIQAEIVYNREKVDKYVLLLKAKDRGETPLETTRFLTVVVLDVNDNAPVFADREFQVDVTENQPLGDIRLIPSATDLDLNPVIVYDIISGNEDGVFELDRETRMLRLLKPLDRESKGIYYIDVQASNDEADYTVVQNRRRRATDPSILTVKIIVGDINDLAPAYLQDDYYGCVSARAPFDKHILTVQAVDRDAIGTGVVRYTVTSGNKVSNRTLFDIHPKFGVVTNKVLMRRYTGNTFFVTINARDRESVETAESANTVAKIFVNQPGNEVRLEITQNTAEVRLYQSQIQSIIEEATDLTYVCINDIQDHVVDSVGSVTTLWSDVYISGIRREMVGNNEVFKILSNTEMKNIVDRERHERKSDFDLLYIKSVEVGSSSQEIELEDQAVLIILIIIAVLIFLVIIFCIVAFLCIRAAKQQKKAMLLHRTHATPAPMMVEQPVIVEPVIVEPVVYDNRAYVTEEQPVVQEEGKVVEYDPVHVQYAVVQKRSPSPQFIEQRVYSTEEDDQDAIVVELKDDEPRPQVAVYETEPEFTIETEVVNDERM